MKASTKDNYMYGLGIVIVVGFFSVFIYLIYNGSYKDAVNLMIGALIASFTTIKDYFFGSSKGSADKTLLADKQTSDNNGSVS